MPLVKLRAIEIEDDVTFSWADLPSSARKVCGGAKINVGVAEKLQQKWPNYTLVQCLFRAVRGYFQTMAEAYNVKRRANSGYAHLYHAPDPTKGQPMEVLLHCPICKWRRKDRHPTYDHDGRYLLRRKSCYRCPPDNSLGWSTQQLFEPDETDCTRLPRFGYRDLVNLHKRGTRSG